MAADRGSSPAVPAPCRERARQAGTPGRRHHEPMIRAGLGALILASLALAACGSAPRKASVYTAERFEMNEAFSRWFDATPEATCDAARRALLSQGYLVSDGGSNTALQARKHFQPQGDQHVQIEFHVHCVPDGRISMAFVSAIQEQYALRRSTNSASVGVSAIGSVSIPVGAGGDSLVKVGSMTIPGGDFYDRFFALMDRFVREQATGN